MLLWYSDGLIERRDADLDAGLARLASIASRLDGAHPQTWCDTVMEQLTGGQRLHDDVVLICLRLQPAPPDAAVSLAMPVEAGGTPTVPRRVQWRL
jgi:hypothetical protein